MSRVNNGGRLPVRFGDYTGTAGVVTRDGVVEVAIVGALNRVSGAKSGSIDGVPYRVLKVAPSSLVDGMVVLTVEASA